MNNQTSNLVEEADKRSARRASAIARISDLRAGDLMAMEALLKLAHSRYDAPMEEADLKRIESLLNTLDRGMA